jgi:Uma2 family endonuclease
MSTVSATGRVTLTQFDQMLKDGTIDPETRVELIDGRVVYKVPKNPPHAVVGKLLDDVLHVVVAGAAPGCHVTKEDDIIIPPCDRRIPDFAIVRGKARDYTANHPTATAVALAIEISESTLESDRSVKMPQYAAANVPVYWIVNLVDEEIEVYTNPAGDQYLNREVFARGQKIPVVIDGQTVGEVPVSDILP